MCTPICGDGKLISPEEACDDDDTDGTWGCNSDCSGEVNGWHCSGGS